MAKDVADNENLEFSAVGSAQSSGSQMLDLKGTASYAEDGNGVCCLYETYKKEKFYFLCFLLKLLRV